MELGQSKNLSNNVLEQKKEQYNYGNQSSEKKFSSKQTNIINENEEFNSPSAEPGVSSPIIKEYTTATSNTIEVVSIPDSENNMVYKHQDENEDVYDLEEFFKDGEEFYSFKEDDNEIEEDVYNSKEENLEKSSKTENTPELYLDANVQGNTKELELNAEANGQDDQNIDEDSKEKEKEKQTQEQNKDKKKEITVPWGLGATLGLEAVAPIILGGTLGPAVILMAILWLSHKSFKLPVTEKAKQFKDEYHKKREMNTVDNSSKTNSVADEQVEEEVNLGTMSTEEQKEFMETIEENKEAFNKTLVDLFIENKDTFEKAFEDMKEVEGIEEIRNYKELIEIVDNLNEIINDNSRLKEEKEDRIRDFVEIGDVFFESLEKNKEMIGKLEEKFNEKEEPIKTNSLFSAFKIVKNAKKVDDDVRKHGVYTSISQNRQGISK